MAVTRKEIHLSAGTVAMEDAALTSALSLRLVIKALPSQHQLLSSSQWKRMLETDCCMHMRRSALSLMKSKKSR